MLSVENATASGRIRPGWVSSFRMSEPTDTISQADVDEAGAAPDRMRPLS